MVLAASPTFLRERSSHQVGEQLPYYTIGVTVKRVWMLEVLSVTLLTAHRSLSLGTQSFLALGVPKLQSIIVLSRLIMLFALTPLGFWAEKASCPIGARLWGVKYAYYVCIARRRS
jgi:hypothetical protein